MVAQSEIIGKGIKVASVAVLIGLLSACSAPAPSAEDVEDTQEQDCVALDSSALITPGKIVFAINPQVPPSQYVNEDNEIVGQRIDLGNAVAEELCLEVEWMSMGGQAMLPALEAKRVDATNIGYFITPERIEIMQMIPVEQQGVSVIVQKGNPKKISELDDLAGQPLATQTGAFEENYMKANTAADIRSFEDYSLAFQALQAGQVTGVAILDAAGLYYGERGEFEPAISGLALTQTAMTTWGDNAELADAISEALRNLKANGKYDEIIDRYGMTAVEDFTPQFTG